MLDRRPSPLVYHPLQAKPPPLPESRHALVLLFLSRTIIITFGGVEPYSTDEISSIPPRPLIDCWSFQHSPPIPLSCFNDRPEVNQDGHDLLEPLLLICLAAKHRISPRLRPSTIPWPSRAEQPPSTTISRRLHLLQSCSTSRTGSPASFPRPENVRESAAVESFNQDLDGTVIASKRNFLFRQ